VVVEAALPAVAPEPASREASSFVTFSISAVHCPAPATPRGKATRIQAPNITAVVFMALCLRLRLRKAASRADSSVSTSTGETSRRSRRSERDGPMTALPGEKVGSRGEEVDVTEPGKRKPRSRSSRGPPLNGIDARKAGTFEGFNYSAVNKSSGITWSEETKYIRAPMQEMPGTRMAFVGIKNDKDIADLWIYLKQFCLLSCCC
jgi:hypothetical protein